MRFALALVMLIGCDDGGSAAPPDADLTGAPPCTGATFDLCTDNSHCTSGKCQVFDQLGITVCTQSCDVSTPCPIQDGQQTSCNNKGLCRPISAHVCTR
jgi:hypothetical protein